MIVRQTKIRPWMLRKEMIILYYGLRDKRTTMIAKLPAVAAVIYLLSPIDLIPDFIPFFGYLDDIVIVPLLLNLAIRLLPRQVREESILKAFGTQKKLKLLILTGIIILIALLAGLFFLTRYIIRHH
jgi:uncharacterized membrane protein YkvA (DUF1232 family)